jgi:hypothetical protein
MTNLTRRVVVALGALVLSVGVAAAQSKTKVSIAVGGAGCLCYLPTVLAKQLGEYDKAGVEVELINFKGGSQALQAVIGGSADVVSGYYDHCVNLAAKGPVAAGVRGLRPLSRHGARGVAGVRQGHQVDQGSRRQGGGRERARLVDGLLPEISAGQERPRSDVGECGRHRP